MRVYESHFEMFLLGRCPRRSRRIAIRISRPNIYWADRILRYPGEILSRSFNHCLVSRSHYLRCFSRRRSLSAYLHLRAIANRRLSLSLEELSRFHIYFVIGSQRKSTASSILLRSFSSFSLSPSNIFFPPRNPVPPTFHPLFGTIRSLWALTTVMYRDFFARSYSATKISVFLWRERTNCTAFMPFMNFHT